MLLLEVKERFVLKIALNSHKSFFQKSYIGEHEEKSYSFASMWPVKEQNADLIVILKNNMQPL